MPSAFFHLATHYASPLLSLIHALVHDFASLKRLKATVAVTASTLAGAQIHHAFTAHLLTWGGRDGRERGHLTHGSNPSIELGTLA